MERVLRSARGHNEVEACDRTDLERLTFEERINAVEQLREVWFGENRGDLDELRLDDILSARGASPGSKLSQALEVMAYGLEVKRQSLQRARPEASANDLDKAFDNWLFERG
jgi:hypothetical protein